MGALRTSTKSRPNNNGRLSNRHQNCAMYLCLGQCQNTENADVDRKQTFTNSAEAEQTHKCQSSEHTEYHGSGPTSMETTHHALFWANKKRWIDHVRNDYEPT